MTEIEAKSFEETLETPVDRHGIIQSLYAELDLEREASATAVSEALSMILRLQEEKAAEKMEAYQYKRMVEEKMHHDEESLATLEELLHHKDMEIASLRSQLKIYKDQALNCGVPILSFSEKGEFQHHLHLPGVGFHGLCCGMDALDESRRREMREKKSRRDEEKCKHDLPISWFPSVVKNSPSDETMEVSGSSCSSFEQKKVDFSGFHDPFEVPHCKTGTFPKGSEPFSDVHTLSREDDSLSSEEILSPQRGKFSKLRSQGCYGALKDLQMEESNIKQLGNYLSIMGSVQLMLLNEIDEQFLMVCSQSKRSPPKKYISHEDSLVMSVMEAMMLFLV